MNIPAGKKLTLLSLLLSVATLVSIVSPFEAAGASIWPSSARPVVVSDQDTAAVEVGLKFRSDVSGTITGIRFYKASANTGTHTGNLWTAAGTRLATARFRNESASGWQQVNFATPVAISANTVYVASYYTSNGRYSCDQNYFATSGVDSPPLHALADGVSGINGVYAYGSTSRFPNLGWRSSNYWVDVVFSVSPTPDTTPPVISGISAGTVTSSSATIRWTTNESSDSQIEYGTTAAYGASTPLNLAPVTAHSQTVSGLTGNTAYHYRVKSRDAAGNLATSGDNVLTTSAPPPALSAITVTPGNLTITAGSTQQFTATGTYSDGGIGDVTSQAVWSSLTTGVAAISSAGLATAVNPGNTTISARIGSITGSTGLGVEAAPLAITTQSLPDGTRGTSYSATLAASGGTVPKSWTLADGSLPTGLTLDSGAGIISGTSTVSGTFSFTCRVSDSGNPQQTATRGFSIIIHAPRTAFTLWSSTLPVIADSGPDSAVELGVKFRADSGGYITGIRFYKAGANTGVHSGSLWTAGGELLATAAFTNESASGWQLVNFSAPVLIEANTVYVASYHTASGHYSCDQYFFAGKGVDSPPLHALADGVVGVNGVYAYGSTSRFPALGWRSSNYWVDVVFTTNSTVVNSLEDIDSPPDGKVTLRSAINDTDSGGVITFDPALNGKTIVLSLVGSSHTVLKGEVYSGMTFTGYADRDYGKSALYVRKNLTIDASALPAGITIAWGGGDANRARVLAVYGDLSMKNVAITSGHSSAEAISGGTQPYTLARGGGLAVWGTVTLEKCTVSGNRITGDDTASRDRGTYGGGIYANGLDLRESIISGNAAVGYGAGGGGIYSVGGADNPGGVGNNANLTGCTVSGNRVTGKHAYGGGIFTLAGGPNNLASLNLSNCTIARNRVEDNTALPVPSQYFYRGGGVYMGGGSLSMVGCTVVENEVAGPAALFSGKPNIGGGGIAATIGNAHVVENVRVQQSIIAGNMVNGAAADWYAGSLLNFYSSGYNRIGVIDFSQILVPIPDWMNLSRKHYPKVGDQDGVTIDQVLTPGAARFHGTVLSAGTDAGQPAVLWYPPAAGALDQVPAANYTVSSVYGQYLGFGVSSDDFLNQVLIKLRTDYAGILGADFGASFGDLTGVTWYGPGNTWPSNPENARWIAFWRDLDIAIGTRLGTVILGDDFWGTFRNGSLGNVIMTVTTGSDSIGLMSRDQLGSSRPSGPAGDIGAIETIR